MSLTNKIVHEDNQNEGSRSRYSAPPGGPSYIPNLVGSSNMSMPSSTTTSASTVISIGVPQSYQLSNSYHNSMGAQQKAWINSGQNGIPQGQNRQAAEANGANVTSTSNNRTVQPVQPFGFRENGNLPRMVNEFRESLVLKHLAQEAGMNIGQQSSGGSSSSDGGAVVSIPGTANQLNGNYKAVLPPSYANANGGGAVLMDGSPVRRVLPALQHELNRSNQNGGSPGIAMSLSQPDLSASRMMSPRSNEAAANAHAQAQMSANCMVPPFPPPPSSSGAGIGMMTHDGNLYYPPHQHSSSSSHIIGNGGGSNALQNWWFGDGSGHYPSSAKQQFLHQQRYVDHLLGLPPGDSLMNAALPSDIHHSTSNSDGVPSNEVIQLLEKMQREKWLYASKSSGLKSIEINYDRLKRDYDELVQRYEKTDRMQRLINSQMRDDNSRLKHDLMKIREEYEVNLLQQRDNNDTAQYQEALNQHKMEISDLAMKNQELHSAVHRQDIIMENLQKTLEEQRNLNMMLEQALSTMQENMQKAKQDLADKATIDMNYQECERSLTNLRELTTRREDQYKKKIAGLEKQLYQLQLQKSKEGNGLGVMKGGVMTMRSGIETSVITELQHKLDEKDLQLLNLQAESNALRFDNSASTTCCSPKEERKSSDDEKHSTGSSRRHSLDDPMLKRVKMFEEKINGLETRLNEKDAMINMLKRHVENSSGSSGYISSQQQSSDSNLPCSPLSNRRTLISHASSTSNAWPDGPLDKTRWRLEATKKRLVTQQSRDSPPISARHFGHHTEDFVGDLSPNMSSLARCQRYRKHGDSQYGGSSMASASAKDISSLVTHGRTQSTSDAYSCMNGFASAGGSGYLKPHDVFTLPSRRAKTRVKSDVAGKNTRPKSADDHLMAKLNIDLENDKKLNDAGSDSRTESSEQLYEV